MRELQSLIDKREMSGVDFHPVNHRVRCYAHIINICASHIIASMTSTSKSYLAEFDAPGDSSYPTCADSDDESDDSDVDPDDDIDELRLADYYDHRGNVNLKRWFTSMKRDPVGRARKVVRLLRVSDQRREGFRAFIEDGNERGWFTVKDDDGKNVPVIVPLLQPLRDVKTRWDSVYMMLRRLQELRPVSSFRQLIVSTN
jgi:hypothetical protein